MQYMPKSKTQEILIIQINEKSQDASRHIDFNSIGFYSQVTEI